jgi:hypothetical protein
VDLEEDGGRALASFQGEDFAVQAGGVVLGMDGWMVGG